MSEDSSILKYVTRYPVILPFLHLSFHDNAMEPSSSRRAATSGFPGAMVGKEMVNQCQYYLPKLNLKLFYLQNSNLF